MKTYFYLGTILKSLFLPSLYLLYQTGVDLPGLMTLIYSIKDSLGQISNLEPYAVWAIVLFVINFIAILFFTDFSSHIYPLYVLEVRYDADSINVLRKEINNYRSKYKGKICEYSSDNIIETLTFIDSKLKEHIFKRDRYVFRNDNVRQEILSVCELPLAIKKSSLFWHRYYIQKSETIFEFHFQMNDRRIYFQSYIRYQKKSDMHKKLLNLNIFSGLANGCRDIIVPVYDQIVMEDINSEGAEKVSAEFYCFIPFKFFPYITIQEVLFCVKKGDEFCPIAKGTLKPKND